MQSYHGEFRKEPMTIFFPCMQKWSSPAEESRMLKIQEPEFRVAVTPLREKMNNIRGLPCIYFDDCFVVSNVKYIIQQGKGICGDAFYMVNRMAGSHSIRMYVSL